MAFGSILGAAAGGSLGTLFVRLTADSAALVRGMAQAELSVTGGSKRMLKQVGLLGAGATAALAGIGVAGIKVFADFEDAMTKSTAIMGDVSADLRKEMELTARTIARDSNVSAKELADSYFFLASAGLSAQQSIAALPVVEKFAVAGAFDMARATDLLTDAQSALGLSSKDAAINMENMTRLSDVLVKANTAANASVEQFSEALTNRAAAALRGANKEVEEGVAVLAAFADQGVKGAGAGEQFAIVLRDLQRTALANSKEFKQYGVEVFDAQLNMKNMADIIGDLEKALGPMSVGQRRATFELLGFNDKSLASIQSLIGMSSKIREYEKGLREAGGTTKDVADKQLQSFNNQLKMSKARITDLFLSIGEGLVPVFKDLNSELKDFLDESSSVNSSLRKNAELLGTAFVTIVKGFGSVLGTFMTVLRMVGAGILEVVEFVLTKFDQLLTGLNKFAALVNKAGAAVGIKVDILIDQNSIKELITTVKGAQDDILQDLSAQLDKIKPPEIISPKTRAAAKGLAKDLKETVSAVAEELKQVEASSQRVQAILMDMKGEDERHGITSPDNQEFQSVFNQLQDPTMQFADNLTQEIDLMKEHLRTLEEIGNSEVELTAEVQEAKLRAIENYNERLAVLQAAQYQLVFSTASTMFDDLAGITKEFAGHQSGVYKAMFAVSKAFALAEAVVKIQQGIAAAASQTWPLNLVAIASVVSATAGVVSTIKSAKLEFGGGRQFGGDVFPGKRYKVGEGGSEEFEPMVPGRIIPNNQLGGQSTPVRVIINNFTDARPEVKERDDGNERVIEVMIRRVKKEIGSEIQDGTGEVSRSMQSAFNLRRGKS